MIHPKLVFFDVLYIDGEVLLDKPYKERRQRLESCIRVIPGFTMIAERTIIDFTVGHIDEGASALAAAFSTAQTLRQEGLVLKSQDGLYRSGIAIDSSNAWIKMKADYMKGVLDSLDLCIVGVGWDPERGDSLGHIGPSIYTTVYYGYRVQSGGGNKTQVVVVGSSSWGQSGEELRILTDYVNQIPTVKWTSELNVSRSSFGRQAEFTF